MFDYSILVYGLYKTNFLIENLFKHDQEFSIKIFYWFKLIKITVLWNKGGYEYTLCKFNENLVQILLFYFEDAVDEKTWVINFHICGTQYCFQCDLECNSRKGCGKDFIDLFLRLLKIRISNFFYLFTILNI